MAGNAHKYHNEAVHGIYMTRLYVELERVEICVSV